MHFVFRVCCVLLTLFVVAAPRFALARAVITGSLALPFNPAAGGRIGLSEGGTFDAAQKFVTDNQTYTFDSVIARLRLDLGNPLVTGEIRAHDETNDLPVTTGVLASFAQSATLTATYADYTFTPGTALTLAPQTAYWIVLRTGATDAALWAFGEESEPVTGPGTVPARVASSTDGGATFSGVDDTPYLLEVNGTIAPVIIPEAGTGVLVCGAIAGYGMGVLLRARQTKPRRYRLY